MAKRFLMWQESARIVVVCCLSSAAFADHLSIDETPWALSLPAVSENGAVYLAIHNHASEADDLVGGVTPIAERVELHQHIMQDG